MANRLLRLEAKYDLLHANVNLVDRLKLFFVDLVQMGEHKRKVKSQLISKLLLLKFQDTFSAQDNLFLRL